MAYWNGLPARGGSALGGERFYMYYVYIIYSSKLGKHYIGFTDDLKARIKKHNSGSGSIFTKKGIPWKLIYYEAFLRKENAQIEERFLKTGKGRERMKFILKISNIRKGV